MKINLNDLSTFLEVVRHKNFTKTATKLGITQSAVSQSMGNLENQIGLKLFNRTTRSLTLTEAGERLQALVGNTLEEILVGLEQLTSLKDTPSGLVRISADAYTIKYHLWPKLKPILRKYPDISIELISENRRIDIAKDGYDAGVRLGNLVEKDMVAIPISQEIPFRLVASPAYLERMGTPYTIDDLKKHKGIYVRLLTENALMPWKLQTEGKSFLFKGDMQISMTSLDQILDAAIEGFGIAYLPYQLVEAEITEKALASLLENNTTIFPAFYLFYTSRHLMAPAFSIIKDALKEY